MAPKRPFVQAGEEEDAPSAPQRLCPTCVDMSQRLQRMQGMLCTVMQDMQEMQEMQNVLCCHPHSAPGLPAKRIQATVTRPYWLRFQSKLPDTLFTRSRIEAEGNVPVQIAIINTDLNDIITSGPLSTTKIKILVLDGDFGGDGQEEWTEEEFSNSIVRERENRGPLLTGKLIITLNNGVGHLSDATFTDNSSWRRSGKFRLGARVYQSRCSEGVVHEAITEAFCVKDHRGESYKKHHPPALSDKVWRLENIGKDGAFHKRLEKSEIYTVQDFLRQLVMDQDRLRSILGDGMKNKMWEATVKHVNEFVLDDKRYAYFSEHGAVLLFDSIFRLVGATLDHIDHPLEVLTPPQKDSVNRLKELAYKNPSSIKPLSGRPHMIDDVSSGEASIPLPGNPDLSATHIDEPAIQSGFQHPYFNMSECWDLWMDDFSIPLNSEADIASSSQLLMGCDHGNGMMQASRSHVITHLTATGARVFSCNWFMLMAPLKWRAISKRKSAKRARIEDQGYPIVASS